MAYKNQQVDITFTDGNKSRFAHVGGSITNGVRVQDGCLFLYHKDGDGAPLTHVMSIPLHNILSWKVE